MNSINTMDKQARTLPWHEVVKGLDPRPAPVRPLADVYADIAKLGVRSLEDLDQDLCDELGSAVLDHAKHTVRSKGQYARDICAAGYLDQEDLVSEIALKVTSKTHYLTTKELKDPERPEDRMKLASRVGRNQLHDTWKEQTPHFGREVKDPDAQPGSPRKFAGGYRIDSFDQLLEDAYEPVLSLAAWAPTPEQNAIFPEKAREVFQLIRSRLTDIELAAFLTSARDQDPVIAGWAADCGAAEVSDMRNAKHRAKKKLAAMYDEIRRILFDD
ncbi:MAG: hypothetical protein NC489_44060 [Ruminococcus flavefaciens]|nr:hypothetical protein [Ruminococcus flavefaciens]